MFWLFASFFGCGFAFSLLAVLAVVVCAEVFGLVWLLLLQLLGVQFWSAVLVAAFVGGGVSSGCCLVAMLPRLLLVYVV
ncbi:hypothetical protein U1Q18_042676 [Sarracenia purpurea var. burkii]